MLERHHTLYRPGMLLRPGFFLVLVALLFSSCAGDAGYVVGDAGPGGGIVFYVADEPFRCGPDFVSNCTFLEAAPVEA